MKTRFALLCSLALAACNDRPKAVTPEAAPTPPDTLATTATAAQTAVASAPPTNPAAASTSPKPTKIRVIELTQEGDLPTLIRAANVRAKEEGRVLVVYVGADWCPPCKRFHEALLTGELDEKLPRMTVLMVNLDDNKERVLAAGYGSKYIPFFAIPGPDGRKAKGFEVSTLKKEQAMAEITAGLLKWM